MARRHPGGRRHRGRRRARRLRRRAALPPGPGRDGRRPVLRALRLPHHRTAPRRGRAHRPGPAPRLLRPPFRPAAARARRRPRRVRRRLLADRPRRVPPPDPLRAHLRRELRDGADRRLPHGVRRDLVTRGRGALLPRVAPRPRGRSASRGCRRRGQGGARGVRAGGGVAARPHAHPRPGAAALPRQPRAGRRRALRVRGGRRRRPGLATAVWVLPLSLVVLAGAVVVTDGGPSAGSSSRRSSESPLRASPSGSTSDPAAWSAGCSRASPRGRGCRLVRAVPLALAAVLALRRRDRPRIGAQALVAVTVLPAAAAASYLLVERPVRDRVRRASGHDGPAGTTSPTCPARP